MIYALFALFALGVPFFGFVELALDAVFDWWGRR